MFEIFDFVSVKECFGKTVCGHCTILLKLFDPRLLKLLKPLIGSEYSTLPSHYENLSMQSIYSEFLSQNKKLKISMEKKLICLNIFAQNIHCGYTLDFNEYPLCMFWNKNKKNRYTSANPSFAI